MFIILNLLLLGKITTHAVGWAADMGDYSPLLFSQRKQR